MKLLNQVYASTAMKDIKQTINNNVLWDSIINDPRSFRALKQYQSQIRLYLEPYRSMPFFDQVKEKLTKVLHTPYVEQFLKQDFSELPQDLDFLKYPDASRLTRYPSLKKTSKERLEWLLKNHYLSHYEHLIELCPSLQYVSLDLIDDALLKEPIYSIMTDSTYQLRDQPLLSLAFQHGKEKGLQTMCSILETNMFDSLKELLEHCPNIPEKAIFDYPIHLFDRSFVKQVGYDSFDALFQSYIGVSNLSKLYQLSKENPKLFLSMLEDYQILPNQNRNYTPLLNDLPKILVEEGKEYYDFPEIDCFRIFWNQNFSPCNKSLYQDLIQKLEETNGSFEPTIRVFISY